MTDKSKFNFSFWPWKSKKKDNVDNSTNNAISKDSAEQSIEQEDTSFDNEKLTSKEQQSEINGSQLEKTTNLVEIVPATNEETTSEKPKKFFNRIWQGLKKTRNSFISGITHLFKSNTKVDEDLLDNLEEQLLTADIGTKTTNDIMDFLRATIKKDKITEPQQLLVALKDKLTELLQAVEEPLIINKSDNIPFVILVVGVNGVGKTTTIGKLANKFKSQGHSVMLAAGDTFRAAATEQLKIWAERNSIPIVAQQQGSDSASVIYDAVQSAIAKNTDILIADTAGRLHNKDNLMQELKKIKKVLQKINPNIPQETILILDATTGQNAVNQAQIFHNMIELTSVILTKLDGTAKGGVIFPLSILLQLPIKFIGVGEKASDLRPFSSKEFIDALFIEEEPEKPEG